MSQWSIVGLAVAAMAAGCSTEVDTSYASQVMGEIHLDCNQAVMCAAASGATLEDNPIDGCVEETREKLNQANDAQRAEYLRQVAHCRDFILCDYVNCLRQPVLPFGEIHADKINHDCAAQVSCETERGIASGPDPMGLCVEAERRRLDMFTQTQKRDYQERFAQCATLTGCLFADCFHLAAATP